MSEIQSELSQVKSITLEPKNVHELLKAPGASELRGRFGFQDARLSKGKKFKTNQVK